MTSLSLIHPSTHRRSHISRFHAPPLPNHHNDTLNQLLNQTSMPTRAKTLQPIQRVKPKEDMKHASPTKPTPNMSPKHDSKHDLNMSPTKHDSKHDMTSPRMTSPRRDERKDEKPSRRQSRMMLPDPIPPPHQSPTHGRRSVINQSPRQPAPPTSKPNGSPPPPLTSRRMSRITSGKKRVKTPPQQHSNEDSPKKRKGDGEMWPTSSLSFPSQTTSSSTSTSTSTSTSASTSTSTSTSTNPTPRLSMGIPMMKLDLSAAQSLRSPYTRRDARRINGTEEQGLDEKRIELHDTPDEMDTDTVVPLSGSHMGLLLDVGVADDPNPAYRPTMEDAHVIKIGLAQTLRSPSAGTTPQSPTRIRRPTTLSALPSNSLPTSLGGFFGIYDGHGGRDCVDLITSQLHRDVMRRVRSCQDVSVAIEQAFLSTDGLMAKQSKYQDCGSTAQVIFIRTNPDGTRTLYAANVGDAQAFIAVDKESNITQSMPNMSSFTQPTSPSSSRSTTSTSSQSTSHLQALSLSYPHIASDVREIARIKAAGGRVFMGRVNGSLAVSRAFGDFSLKRMGVTAQPYQFHITLTSHHKFVIIGCDGIWDVMTGQEAIDAVCHMTSAQAMAKHLINMALERNTTDNVSCMVIRLHE